MKKSIVPLALTALMVFIPLAANAESSGLDGGFQVRANNTQDKEIEATAGLLLSPSESDPGETDPGETDPGETDPGETDPVVTEKDVNYAATVTIDGFNSESGVPYKVTVKAVDVNGESIFDTYEGTTTGDNSSYEVNFAEEGEKVDEAPTGNPRVTQVDFQLLSATDAALKRVPVNTFATLNETDDSYSYDLGDYTINADSTDRPLTGDINSSGSFYINISTLRWELEPEVTYTVNLSGIDTNGTSQATSSRNAFPISQSYFNERNIDGFVNVTNAQLTWNSTQPFDRANVDIVNSSTNKQWGLGLCSMKEDGKLVYKNGHFSVNFGVATLANVNSLMRTCDGYRDTYCTDNGYSSSNPDGSSWCTPAGKPIAGGVIH